MKYELCVACEGKGYINVADGPDDIEQVLCSVCEGAGRVEVVPF